MVYAYDLWAQLPVKDIYDTQMMLAHVSQVKDMYEKAALEMKDFKKEYGDFYSSRPEDMDWYRNEYGKIKNTMDQLYAQGLDLRSPEFRSEMARARDSFDIAEYNKRKKSAANYDIYLLNLAKLDAAGKYNPQMEDAIIRSLGLNDPNKIWDRLSPSIYQDQIEITDNIFDKMEDDFIETDKDGIDWYGVSRDRRTKALDAAIGDILNTPSGKFHYDQYKAAHPELNEADALAGFKNDLLNMSNKYEHRKGVENPALKRLAELRDKIRLENLHYQHQKDLYNLRYGNDGNPTGNGNKKTPSAKEDLGMKSHITNSGLTMLAGTLDYTKFGISIKPNLRNIFNGAFLRNNVPLAAISSKSEKYGDKKPIYDGKMVLFGSQQWNNIKLDVLSSLMFVGYKASDFPEVVNRPASSDNVEASLGIVTLQSSDLPYLHGEDELFSHMYGGTNLVNVSSKPIRELIKKSINEGKTYKMIPTRNVLPSYDKTGVISMNHEVKIQGSDGVVYGRLFLTENSRSPRNEGDKMTIGSMSNPVIYMDARELDANAVRLSSISLDKKYGANVNAEAETPASGTWTGYKSPIQPLDDVFFDSIINY